MLRNPGDHLRLNIEVKPAKQYMTLIGIEAPQGFVKLCASLLTSKFVTKQEWILRTSFTPVECGLLKQLKTLKESLIENRLGKI